MKNLLIASLLALAASLAACEDEDDELLPENLLTMPYNVTINPADFESSNITGNLFWPLATGDVLSYERSDEDGANFRGVTEWTADTTIIAGDHS